MSTPVPYNNQVNAITIQPSSSDETEIQSLDERVTQALSQTLYHTTQEKTEIVTMANDPKNTSDPNTLLSMQRRMAQYEINIRYAGSLAHKVTDTVSTLLKS